MMNDGTMEKLCRLNAESIGLAGVPLLDPAGSAGISLLFARGWAIDLGDHRWLALAQELLDTIGGRYKRGGELRKTRFAYDDQKNHSMFDDGGELVRFVTDVSIVSERNPSSPSDLFQPYRIGTVRWEMIAVPLHLQSRLLQDSRKYESEITVGEEGVAHAARSKTIASSTAPGVIS